MVLMEERTNEQSGDSDKDHDRESDRGVTQSRRRRKTSLMDTSLIFHLWLSSYANGGVCF